MAQRGRAYGIITTNGYYTLILSPAYGDGNRLKIKDFEPLRKILSARSASRRQAATNSSGRATLDGIIAANSRAVYFWSVCSAFPRSEKMRVDYICLLPVQEIHKKLGDILDGKNGWNGVQGDSGADHPAG